MKTFKNETTEIPRGDEMMDYVDLMRNCLDHTPANGFTFADMRERGRIEKAIDAASNGVIKLEDNDATVLKKVVDLMRWGTRHKDLIAFADAVEALAKAKPDEKVKEVPEEVESEVSNN